MRTLPDPYGASDPAAPNFLAKMFGEHHGSFLGVRCAVPGLADGRPPGLPTGRQISDVAQRWVDAQCVFHADDAPVRIIVRLSAQKRPGVIVVVVNDHQYRSAVFQDVDRGDRGHARTLVERPGIFGVGGHVRDQRAKQ